MSKVNKKFIDFGTTGNKVNATQLPANYIPSNYVNADTSTKGHLEGIDSVIGSLSIGDSIIKTLQIDSASTGTWSTGTVGTPSFYARFWDNSESKFYTISTASLDIGTNTTGNTVSYDSEGLTFNTDDYLEIYAYYIAGTTIVNNSLEDDIAETSFSASESASNIDVTGFTFSNVNVRSFSAVACVEIDATSNLYEQFEIKGLQKDSSWVLQTDSIGDDSNFSFSITSTGQIQYSSSSYAGFSSSTIKFRAIITSK